MDECERQAHFPRDWGVPDCEFLGRIEMEETVGTKFNNFADGKLKPAIGMWYSVDAILVDLYPIETEEDLQEAISSCEDLGAFIYANKLEGLLHALDAAYSYVENYTGNPHQQSTGRKIVADVQEAIRKHFAEVQHEHSTS